MFERPDFPDARILAGLEQDFEIFARELTFLPLGADANTAVSQAISQDGESVFVKLRLRNFSPFSVHLPHYLNLQGFQQVIAPRLTRSGSPWADLGEVKLIVLPFVGGRDGYEIALSDENWIELGQTIRKAHDLSLPDALRKQIPCDDYSLRYRQFLTGLLERADRMDSGDPILIQMEESLRGHSGLLKDVLKRTGHLAQRLRDTPCEFVLCHADLHAGNVFIENGSGRLFILDWDDPVLAPRERDLMFPGGAQGFRGHTPEEEERLFMHGYGDVQVDREALAYYRFERGIIDLALFGEVICTLQESPGNREQALVYFNSNFLSGGTIERAYAVK